MQADLNTMMDIPAEEQNSYKMYPSRWGVFLTVFLFPMTNDCLSISFPIVATKAAEYYEVDVKDIDALASVYFYIGIPCCLAVTWIIDRFGLR